MGKIYERIDERLADWIGEQQLFFVATAPGGATGHVNVSPKGPRETFAVLGPLEVAYLDLIGSGIETVAHLRENGRIVVMFCAFAGPPRILRLHGRGEVVAPDDARFETLAQATGIDRIEGGREGSRTVVRIDVERIADSCGYGVPLMSYEGERPQRVAWLDRKQRQGETALDDYVRDHAVSIDGLVGIR